MADNMNARVARLEEFREWAVPVINRIPAIETENATQTVILKQIAEEQMKAREERAKLSGDVGEILTRVSNAKAVWKVGTVAIGALTVVVGYAAGLLKWVGLTIGLVLK